MVSVGANVIQITIKATDQASAEIDKTQKKVGGLGAAVKKLRGPLLAIGAASVGMGALAVKSFADFEQAMANVNTLLDEGQDANDLFGESVKRIATELPIAGGQLAVTAGLYQTISAGISDTTEATIFLEEATKAAIGGQAELSTVILAGTKALAAFGIEAEDSSRVFDVFAATVKAGQTTLPELAQAFPVVAGSAAEMGVSLEETAGVLAGLTKILPSTDEAATSLNAVLTGLLKPSEAMKEALSELGFESGQAAIEQEGLIGLLNVLKEQVDGDAEAMGDLFGNVRALRAVFPALGSAADDVAESIKIVGESSGLAAKQFEDQESTTASRLISMQNRFEALTISLGEKLVPILEKLFPIFEAGMDMFGQLDPVIQAGIVVIGALAGVFALVAPAISGVIGLIGGAGGLVGVLTVLTGPIGLIIGAIALLAAAWVTNFGGIQDITNEALTIVGPLFEKIVALLTRVGGILVETLMPAFQAFSDFVAPIIGALWETTFKPTLEFIVGGLTLIVDTLDALLSALEGDAKPLEDILKKIGDIFTNMFDAVVQAAFDFGMNFVNSIVEGILSVGNLIAETIASLIPPDVRQFLGGAVEAAGGVAAGIGAVFGGGGPEPVGDLIISGNRVFKTKPTDTVAAFEGGVPFGMGEERMPDIGNVEVNLINPVFNNDLSFEENGRRAAEETVRQYRRLVR